MITNDRCSYDDHSRVTSWSSVDEFCVSEWGEGVHVVALDGGRHLDVQVGGDPAQTPAARALPVFFSGAVVPREGKVGPFFSGGGIAERLSSPFIAFSDPLVDSSSEVPLGWYTGRVGEALQDVVTAVLAAAQKRYGELVLVGGSGGGYAAVLFADRIGASAFVWNPQTDVLMYAPPVVRTYLAAASGLTPAEVANSTAERRAHVLDSGGIQHSVTTRTDPGVRRLVYLQSASDWHVGVHAAPFLRGRGMTYQARGVWTDASNRAALQLSHFSNGHTPPHYTAILRGVQLLLDPSQSPEGVLQVLQREQLLPEVAELTAPRDLSAQRSRIEENLRLVLTGGGTHQLRAQLLWGDLPKGFGGIMATFRDTNGTALTARELDPYSVDLEPDAVDGASPTVTLTDGLGQQLCSLKMSSPP